MFNENNSFVSTAVFKPHLWLWMRRDLDCTTVLTTKVRPRNKSSGNTASPLNPLQGRKRSWRQSHQSSDEGRLHPGRSASPSHDHIQRRTNITITLTFIVYVWCLTSGLLNYWNGDKVESPAEKICRSKYILDKKYKRSWVNWWKKIKMFVFLL